MLKNFLDSVENFDWDLHIYIVILSYFIFVGKLKHYEALLSKVKKKHPDIEKKLSKFSFQEKINRYEFLELFFEKSENMKSILKKIEILKKYIKVIKFSLKYFKLYVLVFILLAFSLLGFAYIKNAISNISLFFIFCSLPLYFIIKNKIESVSFLIELFNFNRNQIKQFERKSIVDVFFIKKRESDNELVEDTMKKNEFSKIGVSASLFPIANKLGFSEKEKIFLSYFNVENIETNKKITEVKISLKDNINYLDVYGTSDLILDELCFKVLLLQSETNKTDELYFFGCRRFLIYLTDFLLSEYDSKKNNLDDVDRIDTLSKKLFKVFFSMFEEMRKRSFSNSLIQVGKRFKKVYDGNIVFLNFYLEFKKNNELINVLEYEKAFYSKFFFLFSEMNLYSEDGIHFNLLKLFPDSIFLRSGEGLIIE